MSVEQFYEVKKQIIAEIKKADTIIIHRHQRSDPDALGSQVGLAEFIQANYPDKKVYTAGEDNPTLTYLAKMNPPTVSDYQNALIIVVDTANVARIDGDEALAHENTVIKIDHHPDEEQYGDIQWVDPTASSTSEMIADLWCTFQEKLLLTDQVARLLYAGIVGDTNRFLYPSTSPKTMRLAAELMEKDFSHTALNNEMNEIKPQVSKLIGYVLEHLHVSANGVGSIILTEEILKKFDLKDEDTHQIVSLPGSIAGVISWGIFVQQEDGSFRCRLRSKGPIINDIAKEHRGGGHPLASGANAKDLTEIEEILNKLERVALEYEKK